MIFPTSSATPRAANFLTIVQGDMKSRIQAARLHACDYAQAAIAIAKHYPMGQVTVNRPDKEIYSGSAIVEAA